MLSRTVFQMALCLHLQDLHWQPYQCLLSSSQTLNLSRMSFAWLESLIPWEGRLLKWAVSLWKLLNLLQYCEFQRKIKASIGACKSRELICRFNGFSKVPPPVSPISPLAAIKVAPLEKDNHASLLLKPQFYKNVVCLPRVLKPQFYNNVVCLPRVSHSTGWKAHSRGFSIVYFNHLDNHTTMSTTSTPVWVSLQNLPPYLWEEGILQEIENSVGKFIRIKVKRKWVLFYL